MQQTQDPRQDPAQRFLISAAASLLRLLMTPLYYAIRSDMGIQFSAFYPIAMSLVLHFFAARLLSLRSEVDGAVGALFIVLVVLGYIRNYIQARHRRRVRDWSVNSWSTGETFLEPVIFFLSRTLSRRWGHFPAVRRFARLLSSADFIRYVAEPGMLLLCAAGLWSISSASCDYVALMAAGLILVRADAQLRLYLQAHEVADAQMMERQIRSEFETPSPVVGGGVAIAQIGRVSADRRPIDDQGAFDRLSPDLQALLLRDAASQS